MNRKIDVFECSIPFVIQVKHSRSSSEIHENSSENMHVTEIQVKHRKVK